MRKRCYFTKVKVKTHRGKLTFSGSFVLFFPFLEVLTQTVPRCFLVSGVCGCELHSLACGHIIPISDCLAGFSPYASC